MLGSTAPSFRPPGALPFTPPTNPIQGVGVGMQVRSPIPAGTPGSVQSIGYDANAMRSLQLNSPHFNPSAPAFGLGGGQFTQDASQAARMGLGEYNPLTTSRFMPAAEATNSTSSPLMDRLRRMSSPSPVSAID